MAQPVFDGHPLEDYFQDSGEAELMPGGLADTTLQPYLTRHPTVFTHSERMENLCFLIFGAVESLSSLFSSRRMSQRTQGFAERFKYGVISSSLLSPAFPATPTVDPHRRAMSPPLPGRLPNGHSRTPSAAESVTTDALSLSMPPEPEIPVWPITLSCTAAVTALSARLYFFALSLFAATLYYMLVHRRDVQSKPDVMTPSLQALQHLVAAGRLWDTVINDTFTMLENEERSTFCGPMSPRSPSSPLRVALSTSLLTTQTQCDNVRQLLSAITSPSELAQLAEMYAPPSPIKSTFPRSNDSHRPLSLPGSSTRSTPATDRTMKRSTWNGSYASLALAGASPALAQRREKRKSDLSVLLGNASPTPTRGRSRSTLSSPPQLLADVSEEEEGMVTAESSLVEDEEENSFGTAALGLYRNRARKGLRALELHRSTPLSPTRSKPPTTMSPGSKYTSMHTPRHPVSLSSLRQSLTNALASKRFACSHLLALRFEDDEDDVYWEDVRSVMSLLTSTLVDASSRLSEVLDEVEERHLKVDDTASESASGLDTPSSIASPPRPQAHLPLSQAIEQVVSFAPTPSHLVRFASHVDAISSALDDAREQLARCVASLKEERPMHSPGHSSHPSSSSSGDAALPGTVAGTDLGGSSAYGEPSEHPAIQAYERLRRELGLALRECERGRARLAHVVSPPTPSTSEDVPADDHDLDGGTCPKEEEEEEDDDDDGRRAEGGKEDEDEDVLLTVVSPAGEAMPADASCAPTDDATGRLLLAASAAHLPPPGIEQVFEAESDAVGAFARERSTLSREERIRRARAQRRRGQPESAAAAPSTLREAWGPGGDVVQELKDVIWKVGERRRRLAVGDQTLPPPPTLCS